MHNEQSYYARMHSTMSDKLRALDGQVKRECVYWTLAQGQQSILRESNESYLVDQSSIKQFIFNGNQNIKLVSQCAYYQSDYTNYCQTILRM